MKLEKKLSLKKEVLRTLNGTPVSIKGGGMPNMEEEALPGSILGSCVVMCTEPISCGLPTCDTRFVPCISYWMSACPICRTFQGC